MTQDRGPKEPVVPGRPIGVIRPGIPSGPRRPIARGGPHSRWPQYVQYLVVVGVSLLFLMLVVSMHRHHFFTGEYDKFHSADR